MEDPAVVVALVHTAEQIVALVEVQERVDVAPSRMLEGLAVMDTVGAGVPPPQLELAAAEAMLESADSPAGLMARTV